MNATVGEARPIYRSSLQFPIIVPLVLLAIALLFRIVDIFFLPFAEATGEALLHKVLGLLLVLGYLWVAGRPLRDIGFHGRRLSEALWFAAVVAVVILTLGIGAQLLVSGAGGEQATLLLYAIDTRTGVTGGLGLALFLVASNLVNSAMEEGLFRGVMLTHFRRRYSPWRANLLQAVIFGLWHLAWPIYHLVKGEATLAEAGSEAFFAVIGATISGFAFGTLYLKTDNLWTPWLAHTINNTLLNLVHVRTAAGLDVDFFVTMTVIGVGFLAVVPWTNYWARRRDMSMVRTWGEEGEPA